MRTLVWMHTHEYTIHYKRARSLYNRLSHQAKNNDEKKKAVDFAYACKRKADYTE